MNHINSMSYLIIHIQQNQIDTNKLENSLFILYDEYEGNYYLYGNRNNSGYVPYSYIYHYTELDALCYFVHLVMKSKSCTYTIQYNHSYIPEYDLDDVDYYYLLNSVNETNILATLHKKKLKTQKLKKDLLKLYN